MPSDRRVSVVMPARDAEPFVAAAVESILGQTYRDLELVVLDDASTDGTRRILESFASDPRVRILDGPGRGLLAALNAVCAGARGEYLARMDADDVALPDRLARQVGFLETHPRVGAVGGAVELIDEHGEHVGAAAYPVRPAEVAAALRSYNCLPHAAVTMRRAAFESCGGYRLSYTEDYDLWLRMAESWELANLPEPVLRLRSHGARFSLRFVEAQAYGVLLVRAAAEARRAGRTDPLDRGDEPTRALARTVGISDAAVDDAVVDAFATVAAQQPSAAGELAARAAELASVPVRRVHVAAGLRAEARHPLRLARLVARHPLDSVRELRRVRRLRPAGRVARS